MAMTADDYYLALRALLPPGVACTQEAAPAMHQAFRGWATEFSRLDAKIEKMVAQETDPATTLEILPDWERVFGLPDPRLPPPISLTERREALSGKWSELGGQWDTYFIEMASAIGFHVTINTFQQFVAGSPAGSPLYGDGWLYAWQVNAPNVTLIRFCAGSCAGEPLRVWGREAHLEGAIREDKPSHTCVIFNYA
ncbi:MAG: DUF2313 domain-containing protein [Deltaproteobacteria bacterium]|nr:DUF2313 domain-containing protein [Deltaproteobacteria bacterium]